MESEQVVENGANTKWMIISPWWLAKASFDNFHMQTLTYPVVEELGQILLDKYTINIPAEILRAWMEDFRFIN